MSLKIIDVISSPGGSQLNEDRAGASGALGWVIDGATSLESAPFLPAESDVQWLVNYVHEQLDEVGRVNNAVTGREILELVRNQAVQELVSYDFPKDRIHPTCSIGICRDSEEGLELIRVGDVTCVSADTSVAVLSTEYFGEREASAVHSAGGGGLSHVAEAGILERRMKYILGGSNESVFSGHAAGVLLTHSIRVRRSKSQQVLVCSDGFARAVVDYGLYSDWDQIISASIHNGLSSIVAGIRLFESTNEDHRHFKHADDASAILAVVV